LISIQFLVMCMMCIVSMKPERQTEFSTDRLIEEINRPTGMVCSGLIVNELGVIRLTTTSASERAVTEKALRSVMDSSKDRDRFIAFSYLASCDDPEEETIASLARFRANDANKELLGYAEAKVLAFKEAIARV
jgi:hypothetical protein